MVDEKKDQQDKDDNSNKRDSAVGDNNGSATTDDVDMSAPRTFSAVPTDLSSLRAYYEVPALWRLLWQQIAKCGSMLDLQRNGDAVAMVSVPSSRGFGSS
nr:hypothetical protein B0A51_11779 [Rachicladosporium sp. CCFEE 5018]